MKKKEGKTRKKMRGIGRKLRWSHSQREIIEQISYHIEYSLLCNSPSWDRKSHHLYIRVLLKRYYCSLMNYYFGGK